MNRPVRWNVTCFLDGGVVGAWDVLFVCGDGCSGRGWLTGNDLLIVEVAKLWSVGFGGLGVGGCG